MSKRKWKLPAMSLLLFLVLLADGALAGTVFAIARHQCGTFQSSTIQASTAQPRQVALTFDDGPHQTWHACPARRTEAARRESHIFPHGRKYCRKRITGTADAGGGTPYRQSQLPPHPDDKGRGRAGLRGNRTDGDAYSGHHRQTAGVSASALRCLE